MTSHLFLDEGLKERQRNVKEVTFEIKKFSGGELNFQLLSSLPSKVMIHQRVRTSDDLMKILLAVDALRYYGCKNIELFLPYLPYARQDRRCNHGEAFSLKTFCTLINNCNFDAVHIFDCHSEVGPALLENCINHSNEMFIIRSVRDFLGSTRSDNPNTERQSLAIVAPDLGAVKKIYKIVEVLSSSFPEVDFQLVTADKIRNLATGEIIRTHVYADTVAKDCLIIDDIIDGGRTMIEVSKILEAKGAERVGMAVSHGIFSKGLHLFNDFSDVYTTCAFRSDFVNIAHSSGLYKQIPHLIKDLGIPIEKFHIMEMI